MQGREPMKLLLKIKYDGAAFHGFQAQPFARNVQGTLTEKLTQLFAFPVAVTGCSRTDAGVHALGFVVSVEPKNESERGENWCRIPVSKIARAANNLLDPDICVIAAAKAPDGFHPRYDAVGKEYIYRIHDSFIPDPFRRQRVMLYGKSLSAEKIALMNEASGHFVGRHNFTSFMASGSKITEPVRTVRSASVERADDEVVFKVSADGFLYNMVRIMTGTLLAVAEGKITPDGIGEIINARDRSRAGETVCPNGLYLNEVFYKDAVMWEAD